MASQDLKLPDTAHTSRPWRIHEIAPDFRLEDVWRLPPLGGPEEFARVVELLATLDLAHSSSRTVRSLAAMRWKIGELFGWDDPEAGIGSRVSALSERLPASLREHPGPEFETL